MKYAALALIPAALAYGQTIDPARLRRLIEPDVQTGQVVVYQLQQHLLGRVPPLPGGDWPRDAGRIRRELREVLLAGWSGDIVHAPPRFTEHGVIEGSGYRIRKLRYEIVPGLWSVALLYEPAVAEGKRPGILNVNGHGQPGKALPYKQARCIQQARQGAYALNLEWFFFGEMTHAENSHWWAAHFDLAGANGAGLFYLAMRKGLDYLAAHDGVDPERLGVTGLSGGGWQTIVLSALDERVAAAVPVAGYASLRARIERPGDIGDLEQNPAGFLARYDYPHLTALLAPRPALLIYNANDNCCFRAPLVKADIFDRIRPIYARLGVQDRFGWHENFDPGDHNYELENRMQSYAFFARHFGLQPVERENVAKDEVLPPEALTVGLPDGNLTLLGLARQMASRVRQEAPSVAALRRVVRPPDARLRSVFPVGGAIEKGVEARWYRFDFEGGLAATGAWLRRLDAPEDTPATILLNDRGRRAASGAAHAALDRGDLVLALDLLFTGDAAPDKPAAGQWAQMLAATGEPPLGIRAAHLVAIAGWLSRRPVKLHTTGMRSQITALTAAALAPDAITQIAEEEGIESLRVLFDRPVPYQDAPELFCLGLYRDFDVESLRRLARGR